MLAHHTSSFYTLPLSAINQEIRTIYQGRGEKWRHITSLTVALNQVATPTLPPRDRLTMGITLTLFILFCDPLTTLTVGALTTLLLYQRAHIAQKHEALNIIQQAVAHTTAEETYQKAQANEVVQQAIYTLKEQLQTSEESQTLQQAAMPVLHYLSFISTSLAAGEFAKLSCLLSIYRQQLAALPQQEHNTAIIYPLLTQFQDLITTAEHFQHMEKILNTPSFAQVSALAAQILILENHVLYLQQERAVLSEQLKIEQILYPHNQPGIIHLQKLVKENARILAYTEALFYLANTQGQRVKEVEVILKKARGLNPAPFIDLKAITQYLPKNQA